jgi:riboflavin synthase
MFTGLIEEVGILERIWTVGAGGRRLIVRAGVSRELVRGDSLAVQGVCLTVAAVEGLRTTLEAVGETVRRTTIVHWKSGRRLNLEQALKVGGRLGGHMVTGHVDGTARLVSTKEEAEGLYLTVQPDAALLPYLAPQGSVALDGVSLTIAGRQGNAFRVSLVPTTLEKTTLGERRPGDELNIEIDPLARYVASLLADRKTTATD